MARSLSTGRMATALVAYLTLVLPVLAVDQTFCSSENTGTDNTPLNSIYLSAGKCSDNCNGEWAFAIVQGQNCWCSDYAPASTTSLSDCSDTCPGYPYEFCGSANNFGYIALDKEPAGTEGASSSQAAATTQSSEPEPSERTVTVQASATPSQIVSVSVISIQPDPETTSKTSSTTPTTTTRRTTTTSRSTTSSSSSSSSWSATPYMSIKTVQGGVQTVTITPSSPQAAQTDDPAIQEQSQGGFWNDTGKVAGVFVVVGLLIAALIGAAVFFLLKKRNSNSKAMTVNSFDDDAPTSSNGAPYMVDRRRSNLTLATTGLAGLTRGSSHDKSPNEKTPGSLSRRGSIPMNHDQRLNPVALWNTAHPNGSHASVASFRDDQDYSRPVLHVRNPDQS